MFEKFRSSGSIDTFYVVTLTSNPQFYRRMSVYKSQKDAAIHAMHAIRKYDASKKEGFVTPFWMKQLTDPSCAVTMYKVMLSRNDLYTDSTGDVSAENITNMTREPIEQFKTLSDLYKKYGIIVKNGTTSETTKNRRLLLKEVRSLYDKAKEKFPLAHKYTAWYIDTDEKEDFINGEDDSNGYGSMAVIVFDLDESKPTNMNEISNEIERMAKWMSTELKKNVIFKNCGVYDNWHHNEGNIVVRAASIEK